MAAWKDITSYSQDAYERIPTTWEIRSGRLAICITCGHIYHRPEWVMHCAALGIDTSPLKLGLFKDEAQQEAISRVQKRLTELSEALKVMCEE